MILTSDQIRGLAPDAQVLAAGQKLAKPGQWQNLGHQGDVLWGECPGSAVYQVRAHLAETAFKCSCPSRKQPCKHVIGLLVLGSQDAETPETEPPQWVTEWLARRETAAARREVTAAAPSGGAAKKRERATAAKEKRAQERLQRVSEGIEGLELWLCDLMRNGLASVPTQPASFWERQAARLVDAEAQGLGSWVRRIGRISFSSSGGPERMLGELGRLALLIQAYRRIDELDPALQHDVRQLVGWRLGQDEVGALGERVIDEWVFLGQYVENEDNLRVQRTWLIGLNTGRSALVLQFAVGQTQTFPYVAAVNTRQEMELCFWPGAYPQRARIEHRLSEPRKSEGRYPGHGTIESFLTGMSQALSANPWVDRSLAVLHDVVLVVSEDGPWCVRDRTGAALPLLGKGAWKSLANSGGHPMDLYGEWDGYALRLMVLRVNEDIPDEGKM